MKTTTLGKTNIIISRIGFGEMPLSLAGRPSEDRALAVIHRALELGVTLIDTADSYCHDETDKHHGEKLVATALKSFSGDVSYIVVATKGGLMRPRGDWVVNGDPQHLAKTIRESFAALGGAEPIHLWQWHAPDDHVPLADSLAPVAAAVKAGLIRYVGLSNVSVEEIKRARALVDVVSVQNRYNPWCREPEENGVLEYCEREELTFFPWSPLGGSRRVKEIKKLHGLNIVAQEHGVSPHRIVIAWLLGKSPCIVPIPGTTRIDHLEDCLKGIELQLAPRDVKRIES